VIYTPTYSNSQGIAYRINMMKKALEPKFEVQVLSDNRENVLRFAYRLLGKSLLTHKLTWDKLGERIADLIISQKPDAAILITDVTAGAIPFLKKKGIFTVLSIEDLSTDWLAITNKEAFFQILSSYSNLSDEVIAVSSSLQRKLQVIGIKAKVVKPGLEKIFADPQEAIDRKKNPHILLNSGTIQFKESKLAFEQAFGELTRKYFVKSFGRGKFVNGLRQKFPTIEWYDYPTSKEAIQNLKNCSIGIIIRFNAHNPTRLYFHASMLQPIIAVGNDWTLEVEENCIGVVSEPEKSIESVERIVTNYDFYVKNIRSFAEANVLGKTYAPLLDVLEQNFFSGKILTEINKYTQYNDLIETNHK
jgi:hypothetical protein